MDKNIIYIKTPKCGSTSIMNELNRYASVKKLKALSRAVGFDNPYNISSPWLTRVQSTDIFSKKYDDGGYGINTDHVTRTDKNVARLKSIMRPNREYFFLSSIRDPYERLKSNYMATENTNWDKTERGFHEWYLKNCDKTVAEIFKGQAIFFPDWWIDNFLCNYMGLTEITEEALLAKYDFVTICEHMNESMENLSLLLDFNFKTRHDTKGRIKPKPSPVVNSLINLDKIAKDKFRERNANDYKLYELCKKLFLKQPKPAKKE